MSEELNDLHLCWDCDHNPCTCGNNNTDFNWLRTPLTSKELDIIFNEENSDNFYCLDCLEEVSPNNNCKCD